MNYKSQLTPNIPVYNVYCTVCGKRLGVSPQDGVDMIHVMCIPSFSFVVKDPSVRPTVKK